MPTPVKKLSDDSRVVLAIAISLVFTLCKNDTKKAKFPKGIKQTLASASNSISRKAPDPVKPIYRLLAILTGGMSAAGAAYAAMLLCFYLSRPSAFRERKNLSELLSVRHFFSLSTCPKYIGSLVGLQALVLGYKAGYSLSLQAVKQLTKNPASATPR